MYWDVQIRGGFKKEPKEAGDLPTWITTWKSLPGGGKSKEVLVEERSVWSVLQAEARRTVDGKESILRSGLGDRSIAWSQRSDHLSWNGIQNCRYLWDARFNQSEVRSNQSNPILVELPRIHCWEEIIAGGEQWGAWGIMEF